VLEFVVVKTKNILCNFQSAHAIGWKLVNFCSNK